jgi:hypothetical protein
MATNDEIGNRCTLVNQSTQLNANAFSVVLAWVPVAFQCKTNLVLNCSKVDR